MSLLELGMRSGAGTPMSTAQKLAVINLLGITIFSEPGVLASVLNGLDISGASGSVASTDSILQALAKLQKQVNGLTSGGGITLSNSSPFTHAQSTAMHDFGNVSGSGTLDFGISNVMRCVVTGNVDFTDFTNLMDGGLYHLHMISGGNFTHTWPTYVGWDGGTEPVWSTTAGYRDVVSFTHDPVSSVLIGTRGINGAHV
jgi:hypothetical protein